MELVSGKGHAWTVSYTACILANGEILMLFYSVWWLCSHSSCSSKIFQYINNVWGEQHLGHYIWNWLNQLLTQGHPSCSIPLVAQEEAAPDHNYYLHAGVSSIACPSVRVVNVTIILQKHLGYFDHIFRLHQCDQELLPYRFSWKFIEAFSSSVALPSLFFSEDPFG